MRWISKYAGIWMVVVAFLVVGCGKKPSGIYIYQPDPIDPNSKGAEFMQSLRDATGGGGMYCDFRSDGTIMFKPRSRADKVLAKWKKDGDKIIVSYTETEGERQRRVDDSERVRAEWREAGYENIRGPVVSEAITSKYSFKFDGNDLLWIEQDNRPLDEEIMKIDPPDRLRKQ